MNNNPQDYKYGDPQIALLVDSLLKELDHPSNGRKFLGGVKMPKNITTEYTQKMFNGESTESYQMMIDKPGSDVVQDCGIEVAKEGEQSAYSFSSKRNGLELNMSKGADGGIGITRYDGKIGEHTHFSLTEDGMIDGWRTVDEKQIFNLGGPKFLRRQRPEFTELVAAYLTECKQVASKYADMVQEPAKKVKQEKTVTNGAVKGGYVSLNDRMAAYARHRGD